MKISLIRYQLIVLVLCISSISTAQKVDDYLRVLKEEGTSPLEFVDHKLDDYNLIIFDDAIHSAFEPFEFYQDIILNSGNKIDYVFIEVFGIDAQPCLDEFFNNPVMDSTILLTIFQNDFSGLGWRYETYYNLLSAIWDFNKNNSENIRVIGTDSPIYWEAIHTREQYNIFQNSLIGRDYSMYRTILKYMNDFNSDKKGILLTNTRHAYKNIKDSDNNIYWNCGTFFYLWNKNKTYSVRIHNATLSVKMKKDTSSENFSTQGLEQFEYKWVKPEDGVWDEAFKMNANKPIAFSLKNNVFGNTDYIGNYSWNVAKGQTMYDAYDAYIFLAPLNKLHFSPKLNFIYTDSFKTELERRINILYGDEIDAFLLNNDVKDIKEFIDQLSEYQPKTKNELIKE